MQAHCPFLASCQMYMERAYSCNDAGTRIFKIGYFFITGLRVFYFIFQPGFFYASFNRSDHFNFIPVFWPSTFFNDSSRHSAPCSLLHFTIQPMRPWQKRNQSKPHCKGKSITSINDARFLQPADVTFCDSGCFNLAGIYRKGFQKGFLPYHQFEI